MSTETIQGQMLNNVDPLTGFDIDVINETIDSQLKLLEKSSKIIERKAKLLVLKMHEKGINVKQFVANLPDHLKNTFEKVISANPVKSLTEEFQDFQSNHPKLISLITEAGQDFKNGMTKVFEALKGIGKISLEVIKGIFKAINLIWDMMPGSSLIMLGSILLFIFGSPIGVLEFLKLGPIIAITPAFDAISTIFSNIYFDEFYELIPELIKLFAGKAIGSMPGV